MKITSKGQVTVPQKIRERFGFLPNTEVAFVIEGKKVVLRGKKGIGEKNSVRRWLASKAGTADTGLSTKQIMALTRR